MASVDSSIHIDVPPAQVFDLARQVERFPEIMPNIVSVEVAERDGDTTVTKWVASVPELGTKLGWTEEDVWDPQALTCDFHQIGGEYGKFEGRWTFEPDGEGTLFTFKLEVEYDVPLLGALLKGLIAKKAKENVSATLQGIKKAAEAQHRSGGSQAGAAGE